jgi:zinc/manganese transport system substrate-binding protein
MGTIAIMNIVVGLVASLTIMAAAEAPAFASDGKIAVVAAENFYGDVAQQIGGDTVSVTSILSNPDQDPHLFEISPSVVRAIAAAQVVVYNGIDYDPWIERLLKVTPRSGRAMIAAAGLMHKQAGDNPHLWYDPTTMPAVAGALAAAFTAIAPAHADTYAARLKIFIASLEPLNRKIAAIGARFAGVAVTASEPVFGYMAAALHLTMRDQNFQRAIMNDTEPSAGDVAGLQRNLKTRQVRVMFYNKQAVTKVVQRLVDLARANNVPVVGVTETAPRGLSYQDWVQSELDATEKALGGSTS